MAKYHHVDMGCFQYSQPWGPSSATDVFGDNKPLLDFLVFFDFGSPGNDLATVSVFRRCGRGQWKKYAQFLKGPAISLYR
jgi:hypothetical protein